MEFIKCGYYNKNLNIPKTVSAEIAEIIYAISNEYLYNEMTFDVLRNIEITINTRLRHFSIANDLLIYKVIVKRKTCWSVDIQLIDPYEEKRNKENDKIREKIFKEI